MNCKTIAITNQKGGVGKSTTADALTAGLAARGYKVLAVDMDAQANFTYALNGSTDKATVFDILQGTGKAADIVQHTATADLIPASKGLSMADVLITVTGKEYKLKEGIEPIKSKYDYIIIDTPPKTGILTVNALTAADTVIIPAQADLYSIQGITELAEQIAAVKKYCNPALTISGILLTRYNKRINVSQGLRETAEGIAKQLGTKLFATPIRESAKVKEAQVMRKSLFAYAPNAPVTYDYIALIDELTGGGTTA